MEVDNIGSNGESENKGISEVTDSIIQSSQSPQSTQSPPPKSEPTIESNSDHLLPAVTKGTIQFNRSRLLILRDQF